MAEERIDLDEGELTVRQMRAMLESMPADITFADADNMIRFYTGRYRIFDREPENIGTSVIACHSPGIQGDVDRLIAELRDGWRDEAVFLEEKGGRPVSVRYVPIRDGDDYLGILEIAQWADEVGV